jgi:hypothetical protein
MRPFPSGGPSGGMHISPIGTIVTLHGNSWQAVRGFFHMFKRDFVLLPWMDGQDAECGCGLFPIVFISDSSGRFVVLFGKTNLVLQGGFVFFSCRFCSLIIALSN